MNWKRALLGVLFALPVLALLIWGMGQDPRAIDSPLPGNEAPAFTLAVLEGTPTQGVALAADPATGEPAAAPDTIRLEEHRGEIVIVNFFASWCLACRSEHPVLNRAAERLSGEGVRVYGVVYQDSPANALRWIHQMGGQSYPAALDPASRTAIDYGLYGVPETFFIGPDGRVARKHVGPVDDRLIDEVVREIRSTQAGGAS
ncbi:MAG TPA: redoxin domain-containing protein [Longimicrobiales bacterium]|nr:redoxin domain-containing protein [Longimicrobiales bacterium]